MAGLKKKIQIIFLVRNNHAFNKHLNSNSLNLNSIVALSAGLYNVKSS